MNWLVAYATAGLGRSRPKHPTTWPCFRRRDGPSGAFRRWWTGWASSRAWASSARSLRCCTSRVLWAARRQCRFGRPAAFSFHPVSHAGHEHPPVFPHGRVAGAAGTIISVASLFDILFNVGFGRLVDIAGLRRQHLRMPLAMAAFIITFLAFSRGHGKEQLKLRLRPLRLRGGAATEEEIS